MNKEEFDELYNIYLNLMGKTQTVSLKLSLPASFDERQTRHVGMGQLEANQSFFDFIEDLIDKPENADYKSELDEMAREGGQINKALKRAMKIGVDPTPGDDESEPKS